MMSRIVVADSSYGTTTTTTTTVRPEQASATAMADTLYGASRGGFKLTRSFVRQLIGSIPVL